MRHLRIFDASRALLLDLPNVASTHVTMPGALVIDLDRTQPNPPHVDEFVTRLVLAHGHWATVQEVNAPGQPAPEQAADPDATVIHLLDRKADAPPVVPGDDDEPVVTDAMRVHLAMQIICICRDLRCPVVINPAPAEERRRVRRRMLGIARSDTPQLAEPFMQCSMHRDHDPNVEHRWRHGEWMYGIAAHHPDCPRHPARYNRAPQEGQPSPAGLTSAAALAQGRAEIATLADQVLSDPDMVDAIFARHARVESVLVRPYATGSHPIVEVPNSGPGGVTPDPVRAAVNQAARQVWSACGTYYPSDDTKTMWCDMSIGHDKAGPEGPGTAHGTLQGGDRVRW